MHRLTVFSSLSFSFGAGSRNNNKFKAFHSVTHKVRCFCSDFCNDSPAFVLHGARMSADIPAAAVTQILPRSLLCQNRSRVHARAGEFRPVKEFRVKSSEFPRCSEVFTRASMLAAVMRVALKGCRRLTTVPDVSTIGFFL